MAATTDVFTPSKPAGLVFIEREALNTRLVRALKTPGTQLVVYGHSGSGKSSLIRKKLFQIYEEREIITQCVEGMTFESVVLDAFDQLSPYFVSEKNKSTVQKIESELQATYIYIKGQLRKGIENSDADKEKRVIPPQLSPQNLARFLGAANCCWVIDDYHKMNSVHKKKLAQVMKVFTDMSEEFSALKIIAVGASSTARQIVELDSEMRRRVAEIHVPEMTDEEIRNIVTKGFGLLNVEIETKNIIEEICVFSSGLAAICHKLCLLICEDLEVHETLQEHNRDRATEAQLSYALSEYLEDISDTTRKAFETALQLKYAEDVLYALAESDREGVHIDAVLDVVYSNNAQCTRSRVTQVLGKLQIVENGEVVKYNEDSRKYSFSDPFYRTFCLTYFEKRDEVALTHPARQALINSAFGVMRDRCVNPSGGIDAHHFNKS